MRGLLGQLQWGVDAMASLGERLLCIAPYGAANAADVNVDHHDDNDLCCSADLCVALFPNEPVIDFLNGEVTHVWVTFNLCRCLRAVRVNITSDDQRFQQQSSGCQPDSDFVKASKCHLRP
jgi:hypothetical protein